MKLFIFYQRSRVLKTAVTNYQLSVVKMITIRLKRSCRKTIRNRHRYGNAVGEKQYPDKKLTIPNAHISISNGKIVMVCVHWSDSDKTLKSLPLVQTKYLSVITNSNNAGSEINFTNSIE